MDEKTEKLRCMFIKFREQYWFATRIDGNENIRATDDLIIVRERRKGSVDKFGVYSAFAEKLVIPVRFDDVTDLNDIDQVGLRFNDRWGIFSIAEKKFVVPLITKMPCFSEDHKIVIIGGAIRPYYTGVYSIPERRMIVPIKFRGIFPITDNLYRVGDFIDSKSLTYGVFSVAKGEVVIKMEHDRIQLNHEGQLELSMVTTVPLPD